MRKLIAIGSLLSAALALSACGGGGGLLNLGNRDAPDELAISRNAPLVVPPDFNLEPPRPGAPRALSADAQTQAMEALFGPGVRPPAKSQSETLMLEDAGASKPDASARSTAGDPETMTVNKGAQTRDIIAAPAATQDAAIAAATVGG
ncbi:DUF3035 domain-containing protein [Pacificimonas sp. WHA3]|uniref:DUF3035 domain-containing protein n=1 Tax=Pacificimonas pallii TaxID=2827236 RepID=A0ABS6SI76_9SPHN|nr:DUF3035 domain-containing protein [Pacificimonas pallii]MBV7257626.1 DUF3035 domain-containing protein [Pacificimonas pallii]